MWLSILTAIIEGAGSLISHIAVRYFAVKTQAKLAQRVADAPVAKDDLIKTLDAGDV